MPKFVASKLLFVLIWSLWHEQKKTVHLDQSIRAKLLNLAKQSQVDFNHLVTRYAADRFLYRLSQSEYKHLFVLKGATLFKVWNGEPHRPTKDLDFLGYGNNEVLELIAKVKAIGQIPCEDGIQLDTESVTGEKIKEEQEYEGVRIYIRYQLATVKGKIQLDIGFGDAVTPEATEVEIPTFLNLPAPCLPVYPRETVVAEKFQAMVAFGISNSRMKDFYDLLFLARNFEFEGRLLQEAIQATFHRRKTALPSTIPLALTEEFSKDSQKQKAWEGFINKNRLKDETLLLSEVVVELRAFLVPLYWAVSNHQVFEQSWSPQRLWF